MKFVAIDVNNGFVFLKVQFVIVVVSRILMRGKSSWSSDGPMW